ncbi:hypothetical protein ALO82_101126 [Pseudomonas syringae pv. broussonetiae]|uniref:Uncharacterized protein n=1 Tax=Pseudomonas savastanoi TaxID=29438 RepID=A0A3M5JRS7_PSESS|nr:hypothetical protein [Pseudomonas savastanoi]KPW46719.1 hypothetical protein ALO82_101126 [Pseudomonas syringae pv. broussonetiae]RMT26045.1 hypothetical protein ALP51_101195 [Pseudomonas savastanoi]
MIDHRLGGVRQEVGMVLEKPASAVFLFAARKSGDVYQQAPSSLRSARIGVRFTHSPVAT